MLTLALLEALVVVASAVVTFCYCLLGGNGLRTAAAVLSVFAFIVGLVWAAHAGL
jgi:hypothetical protein